MVAPLTYRGKEHKDQVELSDVALAGQMKLNPTPDMSGVYPAIPTSFDATPFIAPAPFVILKPAPHRMSLMAATKLLAAGYLAASALAILSPRLFAVGFVALTLTAFAYVAVLLFGRKSPTQTPAR